MKIIYFTLILSMISLSTLMCFKKTPYDSKTECTTKMDSLTKMEIYLGVDEMPEFIGGNQAFLQFFFSNFKYPNNHSDQGRIVFEFIILEDGTLFGQRILKRPVQKEYTNIDLEGLRVIAMSPKWKPGRCNGKLVPVRYLITVNF